MADAPRDENEFADSLKQPKSGFLAEFWAYLRHSKKWWMLPILVILLILGAFVLLSSTGLGPFIYALF
jgi:hypothetical protein